MRNLRIWFSKTAGAKYVSHLDLNRCMQRALRRSGVPVWYTEGFNPHPYISFALPLPLGVESADDIMDIKLDGEMDNDEIIKRLNAVLPEGLSVSRAGEPWGKFGEIAFAKYELFYKKSPEVKRTIDKILSSDEIACERIGKQNGKKVMKQFNLVEYIKEYDIVADSDYCVLHIILRAGSSVNLNPMILAEAISRESGSGLEALNIRRTALLTGTGEVFA